MSGPANSGRACRACGVNVDEPVQERCLVTRLRQLLRPYDGGSLSKQRYSFIGTSLEVGPV